jgi:multiple sugar transport system permease protein
VDVGARTTPRWAQAKGGCTWPTADPDHVPCGHPTGAFVRVVLPLAFPGIVAVVVFAFTLTASEFIHALAFVSPTTAKVVSTGVPTELIRGDVFFWQSLQAAAILVAVPIAFVFNLFLDRFITGFTMGAVKG